MRTHNSANQDMMPSAGGQGCSCLVFANNRDRFPFTNAWTPTSPTVLASVGIDPDTLNLRSKGQWITAYIQLPQGYSAAEINASTVLLNGTISPILDPKYGFVTNSSEYLVDHNNDGIIERMVKFNRTAVSEFILSKGIWFGNVTFAMTGQLHDGTPFESSDLILVRMPGDVNSDGNVDALDLFELSKAYGFDPSNPSWNPNCDFNEDNKIDESDLLDLSNNYG